VNSGGANSLLYKAEEKKLIRQTDVLSKSANLILPKVKMVTVSWIFPLQKIYTRLLLVQLCLKKIMWVSSMDSHSDCKVCRN